MITQMENKNLDPTKTTTRSLTAKQWNGEGMRKGVGLVLVVYCGNRGI